MDTTRYFRESVLHRRPEVTLELVEFRSRLCKTPGGPLMRVESFPDTRTVYLSLVDEPRPATETREISEGLNVDYDSEGRVIGIEIEDTDLLQKAQTPRHERVKPSANIVLTFHVNVEGQSAPVSYETSLSNIIHLADFMHEMESVDRHIDPEFKRMFPWLPHRPGERKSLK